MAEFKGTPGEWAFHKSRRGNGGVIDSHLNGRRRRRIATIRVGETATPEQIRADAAIIAESKNLLAACQTAEKWMAWWLSDCMCECEGGHTCGRTEREAELQNLRAVIQRATEPT